MPNHYATLYLPFDINGSNHFWSGRILINLGVATGMRSVNKQPTVREYFDSDRHRWEEKYETSGMEAQMYLDRQSASLSLIRRQVKSGGRVLEIGCGTGILSKQLMDSGYSVVSSDFSIRMLRETRKETAMNNLVLADATALPFMKNSFDAIIMVGVIAYIDDPRSAISHLSTLLRGDGVLIVSSANRRMLYGVVSRVFDAPLTWLGFGKPGKDKNRKFFTQTNNYYRASAFNELVCGCGYDLIQHFNIGFGRLRILKRAICPDRINIALSRATSRLSQYFPFKWLQDFAFNNVACFRPTSM